jgi:hypothetical protein
MGIQFLSNENGQITAVLVPLREWKRIKRKVKAFDIADGIRQGLKEAEKIEKGEMEAKSIEQLLDELS